MELIDSWQGNVAIVEEAPPEEGLPSWLWWAIGGGATLILIIGLMRR